jgi:hypothetical protein
MSMRAVDEGLGLPWMEAGGSFSGRGKPALYDRVTVAWRLSKARATVVQAAISAAGRSDGSGCRPMRRKAVVPAGSAAKPARL